MGSLAGVWVIPPHSQAKSSHRVGHRSTLSCDARGAPCYAVPVWACLRRSRGIRLAAALPSSHRRGAEDASPPAAEEEPRSGGGAAFGMKRGALNGCVMLSRKLLAVRAGKSLTPATPGGSYRWWASTRRAPRSRARPRGGEALPPKTNRGANFGQLTTASIRGPVTRRGGGTHCSRFCKRWSLPIRCTHWRVSFYCTTSSSGFQ